MAESGALLGVDNIGQTPLAHCVAAPVLVPITRPVCEHLCVLKGRSHSLQQVFNHVSQKIPSHALDPHIHLPESHKELLQLEPKHLVWSVQAGDFACLNLPSKNSDILQCFDSMECWACNDSFHVMGMLSVNACMHGHRRDGTAEMGVERERGSKVLPRTGKRGLWMHRMGV